MKLGAQGVAVQVPSGWEVRIGQIADRPNPHSSTLLHAANFALPEDRGDFGSGAVEVMGADHVLVVLFEYGPESVHTALFQQRGIPRRLHPDWFSPNQLQRTLAGQAGMQRFFVENGRPFCLYVVLGSYGNRGHLVGTANSFLGGITVSHLGSGK
jgi:hypothetical protein